MKRTITTLAVLFTITSNICFSVNGQTRSNASGNMNSIQKLNLTDGIASGIPFKEQYRNTTQSESDSLPSGVKKSWLNSLQDEKGKRLFSQDPGNDAFQRRIINGLDTSGFFGSSVSSAGDVNNDGYDDIIIGSANAGVSGKAYIYFGGSDFNNIPGVILSGESGSEFGSSVSSAGDVNGDGYSDVIVGASKYNLNTGIAYIFLGGATMDSIPDVTMTGEASLNRFGISVSSAGDVNNDGYSDVVIGAFGYNSNTGRAYIFFGGATMNNTPDVTMNGETTNNRFGFNVSSAGDVNGDGISDVIVGASFYNSNTGRAYIFFGGISMNDIADVTMTGEVSNSYFGVSVSSAGDVNRDGYSDVIVGAYRYGVNTGRAYVFFGAVAMDNSADLRMTGEGQDNLFGLSVSTAGDLNRDGYSDIIIGAPHELTPSDTGKAYIFFGGAAMDTIADVFIKGEDLHDDFGSSVSSAGDVNDDGFPEILVGAQTINSNTGRIYLFDYTLSGKVISDLAMTGEATNNNLGISVSSAGDVNGDGYSDVIVGAYGYNSNTGRAYIFFGGAVLNNTPDVILTGESTNSRFGFDVSTAGDVNNDGFSDVIVGAGWYSSALGKAYIFFGGASMNSTADVTMTGETAGSYFGVSVSSAGDVNGDGFSDVIAGAYRYGSSNGRVYIFFGGASMDNSADLRMTGDESKALLGKELSTAGDVNGDGYSDIIVGAPHDFSPADTGEVYIFYGGVSMDTIPDVTFYGETLADDFGISVSSAGDVNGDGFSDVIVGALAYFGHTGRAYVYFGGNIMDSNADVVMNGEMSNDWFGRSVSSAGDINGDGYSDVIVGAEQNNSNTGKTYLFFGGPNMNNIPDVTMTGEAPNNFFGASLANAGDMNGDGFSDIIVGAPGYNSNTGRAYIFLASAIGSPVNKSFRTLTSGNWNSPLTWEMSTNGGTDWIPATSTPDNTSLTITIRNQHIVTVSQNDSADNIVVENSGLLTVDTLITFRINSLINSGILSGNGIIVSSGTIEYNASVLQTLSTANVNYTNLTINNPEGVIASTDFSIAGSLSIVNGSLNLNGNSITLLETAFLIETPGNSVKGDSGLIITTRNINSPSSLDIGGLGAVISTTENLGITTIIRSHNIQNINTGKPSLKRNFTIIPENNSALNATLIFKYDTSELDTLNESSLGLYSSANGGMNYTFEGGIVDTANNQITVNTIHSFYTWTAARDSSLAYSIDSMYTFNIYVKGMIPINWGQYDTVAVRVTRIQPPTIDTSRVNIVIKNMETFVDLLDTIIIIPPFLETDTLMYIVIPAISNPDPFTIIVQAIPDELDPINGIPIQIYNFNATCNEFSYSEPQDLINGSSGFEGSKGRMVVRFTNLSKTEDFPIYTIEQSFLDSGIGNVPYKLAIYSDGGNGKPDSALYVSPELLTPAGTGSVVTVAHEIDPPLNIEPMKNFYVGYIQTTNVNIRAAYQEEIPVRENSFFFSNSDTNNTWYDFADSSKNFHPDISLKTSIDLTLKAFLEGFYDSETGLMIQDTVKVEVHSFYYPFALVDSAKGLLDSNGTGIFNFTKVSKDSDYYFVLVHRNHIETWSHNSPENFNFCDQNYDFTKENTNEAGNSFKNTAGINLIFSGDVSQDKLVDLTDILVVNNKAVSFATGYLPEDVNGDNIVDLNDITLTFNNANKFISVVIP